MADAPDAHDTADPHNLQRFLQAQDGVYARALTEVASGRKRTHWMWFIFPQLAGLGRSTTAVEYAIRSAAEAEAYLNHPVLGARLTECCAAVMRVEGKSAREIFGSPDDMKLQSCVTLFALVSPPRSLFHRVLDSYFAGEPDGVTLGLLRSASG